MLGFCSHSCRVDVGFADRHAESAITAIMKNANEIFILLYMAVQLLLLGNGSTMSLFVAFVKRLAPCLATK